MSKMGEEIEKAMLDMQSDVEEEYYGVGTTSTTIGGDCIDSVSTVGTSIVDTTVNPYWGTTSGDVVFADGSGGFANQSVISIGPMTLSATEDGEVEVVLENDEFREEYHFSAKTMRGLLRKLADVVVEGKET